LTNTLQDLMTILFTGRHRMIKVSPDDKEAAIIILVQFLLLGDPSGQRVCTMFNLMSLDDDTKDLIMSVIMEAKL